MSDPLTASPASSVSRRELEKLVEKWRQQARADAKYGVKHAMGSKREHYGAVNVALAKWECADELASALSAIAVGETDTK